MSQTRPLSLLLALASLFVIMFGIQETASILNPILLAAVITIAVLPLPGRLTSRGLPGWLALILTVLLVVGAMGLTLFLVIISVTQLTLQLPVYAQNIAERSAEVSAAFSSINEATATAVTLEPAQINAIIASLIAISANGLITVFTSLLIFIFMLSAAISLPSASRSSLNLDLPIINQVSSLTKDVRRYLSITTVVNLLVGIGDTILLLILGVDFAFLWGVLSWILGYIPAVGFWVALIPPTILAWAELGLIPALIVFVGYVLINGSVGNFVQPKMMGDQLNISPVVVFLSLFVWGFLLGSMGALLAVPLTLLIIGVLESFEGTRWLVALMRLSPGTHTEEDQQKARMRLSSLWERAKQFSPIRRENESDQPAPTDNPTDENATAV